MFSDKQVEAPKCALIGRKRKKNSNEREVRGKINLERGIFKSERF